VRDWMYHLLRVTCGPVYWVSTRPVVLHHGRIPRSGGFLLASNHTSFYDTSCLMYVSQPRFLDFITTTEVMARPILGFIGRNMNTIPLDRGRVNGGAVRKVVERLKEGRVVCLFPEAKLAPEEDSVIHGGPHRAGLGPAAADALCRGLWRADRAAAVGDKARTPSRAEVGGRALARGGAGAGGRAAGGDAVAAAG